MSKPLQYIMLLLALAAIAMPLFMRLDAMPIRLWDESRQALNAWEMYNNKKYLITYFYDQPDMWNTKPPLLIWLQVALIHIIGYNEFAIRLPSAIAGFMTCIVIIFASKKITKDYYLGVFACIILVTAAGYVKNHGTRTGDYDALLTLFTTLYLLSFLLYTETKKLKYITLFSFAVTLAIFTKGIQGLLFTPALLIYLLFAKQLSVLKNKWIYIHLFVSALLIASYYLLREKYNPGYLKAVWDNELGGRYLKTLEDHNLPFDFYFLRIIKTDFVYWFWAFPIGIILGLMSRNKAIKKYVIFATITALMYLLIISLSKTKLEWYNMPAIPFLSIVSAVPIYKIFQWIRKQLASKYAILIAILFAAIAFAPAYYATINRLLKSEEFNYEKDWYDVSYYIKNHFKEIKENPTTYIIYNGYTPHVSAYIYMSNDKLKYTELDRVLPNTKVIVKDEEAKWNLQQNWNVTVMENFGTATVYNIISKK